MKKISVLVLLLMGTIALAADYTKDNVETIKAKVQKGEVVLIDVREADEYAAGHLPGAMHMSRGMLEFKLAANPQFQSRDLKITLYCKTSGRAALCAQSLKEMGYSNVSSIAGGFDAWQAAGFHVEKPVAPSFD